MSRVNYDVVKNNLASSSHCRVSRTGDHRVAINHRGELYVCRNCGCMLGAVPKGLQVEQVKN